MRRTVLVVIVVVVMMFCHLPLCGAPQRTPIVVYSSSDLTISTFQTIFASTQGCGGLILTTRSAAMDRPHYFLSIEDEGMPEKLAWSMFFRRKYGDNPGTMFRGYSSPQEAVDRVCTILKSKGGTINSH